MTLAERIDKFNSLVGDIVPHYVKKDLLDKGFFVAPASTKYHGNYEGGLFDHSCAVMKTLVDLTEKNGLKWENPGSPYIVGMFHDLLLSQYFQLTEEEIMCIRYHMGAFCDQAEWSDYTRAIHSYPNVLWTHHADMIAAHVHGV